MPVFKVETMLFINPTDHEINLSAIGMDPVPPKGEVEIPFHLCAPIRKDNGCRGASSLEGVAPQLQPKNPAQAKAWMEVPDHGPQQSKIVSVSARPMNEAPGVKALREKMSKTTPAPVAPTPAGK